MAGIDIEKLGLASVAEGTSQAEKNHSIKAGSKFKSLHAHPENKLVAKLNDVRMTN